MWPFGKKKNSASEEFDAVADSPQANSAATDQSSVEQPNEGQISDSAPQAAPQSVNAAETGPFDIDDAKPEQFDFSDFAKASLNLGSVLLPIPHEGDVQVEMGPQGPTMLHIATAYGRVTPVAFSAPTSGGQWEASAAEIKEGLGNDGLNATIEEGPWGSEVVGNAGDMQMRILGTDGKRWMLRMTASGPAQHADKLAEIARGILARCFVARGDNPMPAGQPLPVTLPAAMAEQIRQAYQQQAAAAQNNQNNPGQVSGARGVNPDGSVSN